MNVKYFLGPMSKNVVDSVIDYNNTNGSTFGFIPSRRQVEYNGGYVNNWTNETFSKYVYDLHETINTMLNKISGLSYQDVRERYEHFRSRCVKTLKKKDSKNKTKKVHFAEKESGCTEPLYGEKSKCVLQIVPQTVQCESLQIDEKCIKKVKNEIISVLKN